MPVRCGWVLALIGMTGLATAQDTSPSARITQLNRAGLWEQAADAAQRYLHSEGATAGPARCEVLVSLTYARTRLGRVEEARASLATYDAECPDLGRMHWLSRQVARLRGELDVPTAAVPVLEDGFWRTADPAALGMDVAALERHRLLCQKTGADACLVVHRGAIVQEVYAPTYRVPTYAMSSTKSITGLLVGLLIDDGKIKSLDAPVCTYVPEWCAGRRSQVTLRHLLSMTSGLPRMYDEGVASTNEQATCL